MSDPTRPVYVTRPDLPPIEELMPYLEQIWESRVLTNNGPLHKRLEQELAEYLGVKYVSLFANGTLALMTALQALEIRGEVITTPFSFVATTHALWWNNIKPVFADVEPRWLTLDPQRIEEAITAETTAILPVHVYGNPCSVEEIGMIAKKHGLKVIYDAAHAFGVKKNDLPLVSFGDLSVLSFHATKVFNTFEGGAIVSHDAGMKRRIDLLRNFGFTGEITVAEHGINGKMNELQAAVGLVQLKHLGDNIGKRKAVADTYTRELHGVRGIKILMPPADVRTNYSYYPILIDSDEYGRTRDELYEELRSHNIYSRRYFYPLISKMDTYSQLPSSQSENLPVAMKGASKILCLPIFSELNLAEVKMIASLIAGLRC
ncbi:MAG: DegT/DnrJ/EryC1/StrS family aminotransferase [Bacteroidales bacterium]|jgi:dTDP-4-amino-4,6-dideoxygalactose transaminase|nr:DegT/DnrJ/EryC1/StrS family aminotransferase [Bacteroidales bacterium]